jgi:hypothetical protein
MPDEDEPDIPNPHKAVGVVWVSGEDNAEDTIRPRLERAGADLTRVKIIDHIPDGTEDGRPVVIPDDLPRIVRALKAVNGGVLLIDPLETFLPDKVSSINSKDVRKVMHAIRNFGEKYSVSVIGLGHLNKLLSGPAVVRGLNSIAFTAATREAWVVAEDPDKPADGDTKNYILACRKPFAGSYTPDSLEYSIIKVDRNTADFEWGGKSKHTAETILQRPEVEEPGAREEAREFLRKELKEGRVLSNTVLAHAKVEMISLRTLKRAKKDEKVKSVKAGGKWYMRLPLQKAV